MTNLLTDACKKKGGFSRFIHVKPYFGNSDGVGLAASWTLLPMGWEN